MPSKRPDPSDYPRTFLENPPEILALACRGQVAILDYAAVTLAGEMKPLTAAERKATIERSRAGEHIELEFDAVTFIQADGRPNRNFIRFKKSRLSAIAKTGKGSVFLRDHAQWSQSERGGTILKSKATKAEDGATVFLQTVRVTTPWAVQGVLDKTIDRFSIGWYPTGPLVYAHSGEEIEGWPKFWPGEVLEDGTIVEWEYSDAELVETSAVNVPAVLGTELVEEVRAALAASGKPRPSRPQPITGDSEMLNRMKAILRLGDGASEDQIVEAVKALLARAEGAEARLELAEARAIDELFDAAIEDGRLELVRDEKGDRVQGRTEAGLRKLARVCGRDALEEQLEALPKKPTPATSPSTRLAHDRAPENDPAESDSGADETGEDAERARLEADDTIRAYAEQTGRSVEDVLASMKKNPVFAGRMTSGGRA